MKSATELLDIYGIPWIRCAELNQDQPTWTGVILFLEWGESMDISFDAREFVVHEISHHLFARDEAKHLPNYGLGTDPAGGARTSKVEGAWRGSGPDDDEGAVCVLDLILMRKWRFSDKEVQHHVRSYSISEVDEYAGLLKGLGYTEEQLEQARQDIQAGWL